MHDLQRKTHAASRDRRRSAKLRARDRRHLGQRRRRQDDDDRQPRRRARATRRARRAGRRRRRPAQPRHRARAREPRQVTICSTCSKGTRTLDDALVSDKRSETLKLLAAAQTREKDDVDTERMRALDRQAARALRLRADRLPGRIETGLQERDRRRRRSDRRLHARGLRRCATPIASSGCSATAFKPQLIINRLRPQLVKKGKMLSVDDVNAILRLPLLGRHRRRAGDHRHDEQRRADRARHDGADRRTRIARSPRASRAKTSPPPKSRAQGVLLRASSVALWRASAA